MAFGYIGIELRFEGEAEAEKGIVESVDMAKFEAIAGTPVQLKPGATSIVVSSFSRTDAVVSGSCRTRTVSPASSSMRATIASASAVRPTDSSQRGDSGRRRRTNQTITAPSEPITNSQRHPAMPNG